MEKPSAEPSFYNTFYTLCTLALTLAVLMVILGGFLLMGAFVNFASTEQIGASDIAKIESKALTGSLVSYGITCFTSGIPLLVFSYGGWIFLDLARNNRLHVHKTDEILHKTDEILEHLAELNPKYEERLKRQKENYCAVSRQKKSAHRKAENERAEQDSLARRRRSERNLIGSD